MCLLIVLGFLFGDEIIILAGGDLGDRIHSIGILDTIIIISISIWDITQEVLFIGTVIGIIGIMVIMDGGLGR
jgi:uncharacterized membrane protein